MAGTKLDLIRKLLAKADRAATVEEADSYTAKAMQLMARHGIAAALLDAAEPGRDPIGPARIGVQDPYSAGKARLLAWTADALGCRAVLHPVAGGRIEAVTVFGHASDRERVELLFTSLLLQATGQLVRARPTRPGESVAAYRRSWLQGFAARVHRRLTEAGELAAAAAGSRREQRAGPGVALVLAGRATRVEQAYAAAFPLLGRARRPQLSGSGAADGRRAADRADLGTAAVGAGGPAVGA